MSSQPQLQPFTAPTTHDVGLSHFHCFPDLPLELRRKMWRHSVQRERLINVVLSCELAIVEAKPANTFPFQAYTVIAEGHQVLSKLLRVNRESRKETLQFYRVHIPCKFMLLPEPQMPFEKITGSETLYFNPEYDFLQIHLPGEASNFVKETLIDFLYHLKTTYDPRHIGLLKLAIGSHGSNGLRSLRQLQPSDLDPAYRTAFSDILAQLREVFIVTITVLGRHVLGWYSMFTGELILNRSLPIVPSTPAFDRLGCDPRAIAEDLKHVRITHDASWAIGLWREILNKWAVSSTQIEYRFYFGFRPRYREAYVYNSKAAESWLQIEDDTWRGIQRPRDPEPSFMKDFLKLPIGADFEKFKNEDLESAVKPAIGFWLFPIESLDRVDHSNDFSDMSEFWPELALSSLP